MFKFGIATLALFALTGPARAQTTIASGGDYIRQVFEEGRTVAVAKIASLKSCNLEPNVKSWLEKNRAQLQNDIQLSAHLWVVDSQPTCAFTNHIPMSSIYLSYPTCNLTTPTAPSAAFTLIHEAAHHLGVVDEKQADAIALAVMNTSDSLACSFERGDDTGTVFDPNICQGPAMSPARAKSYLQPGQTSATIGDYKLYVKTRYCDPLSGCENWKEGFIGIYSRGEGYIQSLKESLKLNLKTFSASPYYYFDFSSAANDPNLAFRYKPVLSPFTTLELSLNKHWIALTPLNYPGTYAADRLYDYPSTMDVISLNGASLGIVRNKMEFVGAVKDNCGWYIYKTSSPADQGTQEFQLVIYGKN